MPEDSPREESERARRPRRPAGLRGAHGFRLPVGAVLRRGLGVWLGNFPSFSVLSVLVGVPVFAGLYALNPNRQTGFEERIGLAATWTSLLSGAILSGGLSHAVFLRLQGERVSIGETLTVTARSLLPVVTVSVLGWILTFLGFLACYVPGLVVHCAFFVSVPACVVERPGILASLRRSLRLTERNRMPIFAIAFSYNCLNTAGTLMLGFVLAAAGVGDAVLMGVLGLTTVLSSGILAVLQGVTYHDLRLGKEGIEVARLAEVFE